MNGEMHPCGHLKRYKKQQKLGLAIYQKNKKNVQRYPKSIFQKDNWG